MSEIRSIISAATSKSLLLVDEICRGTETAKGTCIAGSIIETLDTIGCLGIVSTHLNDIFTLPLTTKNTSYKAMGSEIINGQTKPTWKLIDGICRESLAFETAKREGVPETIIRRAEQLYLAAYPKKSFSGKKDEKVENITSDLERRDGFFYQLSGNGKDVSSTIISADRMEILHKEVENAVRMICCKKMTNLLEPATVKCVLIAAKEQPPPSTIGASSVYVILRTYKRLYVGQTDDLQGRVRAHRLKEGMENASFLYFLVHGKSLACELETLLINQLPTQGFQLTNVADGKHRHFGTSEIISLDSVSLHR